MTWGKTYSQRKAGYLWFAWRPVRLDDGTVAWLEIVERFLVQARPSDFAHITWYEYRKPAPRVA